MCAWEPRERAAGNVRRVSRAYPAGVQLMRACSPPFGVAVGIGYGEPGAVRSAGVDGVELVADAQQQEVDARDAVVGKDGPRAALAAVVAGYVQRADGLFTLCYASHQVPSVTQSTRGK